jgi:hypothetical protein
VTPILTWMFGASRYPSQGGIALGLRPGELGGHRQVLDRDLEMQPLVVGLLRHAHACATDPADQAVTVSDQPLPIHPRE